MKIGIFGGSFNPIHKGHQNIAQEAIRILDLDKLIFVPAHKSPFKKKTIYEADSHRMNMINLILKDKMELSDFEIKRKGTSYTIDTVKYFKSIYPNDSIYIIIGSDQLYKLHKWREIEQIAEMVNIVIFKRSDKFSKTNIKKFNLGLLNNNIYNYSSSQFRKGDFSQIDPIVNEYIGKNMLYINDLLLGMLSPARHKHSLATGKLAAEYAKLLNQSPRDAWLAGAFHDITKGWSNLEHRNFLDKMAIESSIIDNYLLHSLTGSLWLEHIYIVDNVNIVAAVNKHTGLSLELTTLDKIVYAADKLAEGRNWQGIQQLRKDIKIDFEKGFIELVKITMEQIIKKNGLKSINSMQMTIYNKIIKER